MHKMTLAAAVAIVFAGRASCETYTMESYYPAPVGVYTNMTVTSNAVLARDGGKVSVGGAPSTAAKLEVKGDVDINGVVVPGRFATDPTASDQKIEGAIYFNTTSKKHRMFKNAAWSDLGGEGIPKTDPASGVYTAAFTYTAANGTIPVSLTVSCQTYGGSNAESSVRVRWRDAAGTTIKDWIKISGTNMGGGNDGGSGMSDRELSTIPFFTNAKHIDFATQFSVRVELVAYTHF